MKPRGFTLIEVLVALAIVATALLAAGRAMGVMSQSESELKLRLLAQLSAQNRIAFLRATRAFPPTGTSSEPCPQGKVALDCALEVSPTPNAVFRRVEVRVRAGGEPDHVLATLVGILPRQP
ncbi:MAG: type II secretion system minor pseudopilin GspI [Betaproteobacteria bacterium]